MNPKSSGWKLLRRGEPIDLKLFKARFDWYLNERNGREIKMVVVDSQDAVNVVALTGEGNLVLVRQFRFGVELDTLELPGGLVEPGESSLTAARRELEEETGYTGGAWQLLHVVQSNPVFMNSYIHQYLAVGVTKSGEVHLDDGENIEVVELSPSEMKDAYENGLIRHPHTLSGLAKVFDLWEKVKLP